MAMFMLFAVALVVALLLLVLLTRARHLAAAYQNEAFRRAQEIEQLRSRTESLHQDIQRWVELFEDSRRKEAALASRMARLAKYEHLTELELLDAELEKLRAAEREYRARIREHIASANLRANRILKEAERRAEETAGDALAVARDYRLYDQAVKAMKNIVEGYGNKYLIPHDTLVDELADLYGHTEPGRELKRARDQVNQMVRNGAAGECDDPDQSRREIAVRFVVDAFNGKVETILTKVRRENCGTLEREIRDAFTTVNLNGMALRGTRITEQFLNARLEELKLACAVQELKARAAEEQRRLKERIREEAKARRDYERARREAAREEEMLQKALELARRQLEEASETQRADYEAKMQELQRRLAVAEEKNRRALSMAQQTRLGHVYVISNIGSFGGDVYKIGMTRRLEPLDRVRELSDASVPFDFDVHALIECDDAPALEAALHKHFVLNRLNKVNHRREFFRASVEEIREQVGALGAEMGAKATHWTMAADARQYYETLAIDRAIAEDPEAREAWLSRQYLVEEQDLLRAMNGGADDEELENEERSVAATG